MDIYPIRFGLAGATLVGSALAALATAGAVSLTFDFRHDDGDFFATGTSARAVLDQAGADVSALLDDDDLLGIAPGGGNSWRASYSNPAGGPGSQVDLVVGAGEIIVFVGARDLGGSTLGSASPGGYAIISGDADWTDTVDHRGQLGALEFGPWGGSLTVSDTASWDYSTTGASGGGTYNLYSNIVHELGHVLGVGSASSWFTQLNTAETEFLGGVSVAEYGGANVPLEDNGHWQDGLTSTIYGTTTLSETAYDPTLSLNAFKPLTNLDVAALDDIGWDIATAPVPEPGSLGMLLLASCLLVARRAR